MFQRARRVIIPKWLPIVSDRRGGPIMPTRYLILALLSLLGLTARAVAAAPATGPSTAPAPAMTGPAVVITLAGQVDDYNRDALFRRFEKARKLGAKTVILRDRHLRRARHVRARHLAVPQETERPAHDRLRQRQGHLGRRDDRDGVRRDRRWRPSPRSATAPRSISMHRAAWSRCRRPSGPRPRARSWPTSQTAPRATATTRCWPRSMVSVSRHRSLGGNVRTANAGSSTTPTTRS